MARCACGQHVAGDINCPHTITVTVDSMISDAEAHLDKARATLESAEYGMRVLGNLLAEIEEKIIGSHGTSISRP